VFVNYNIIIVVNVLFSWLAQVGRLENAIGWYHSHPGYGCWLSGIDVGTQMLNQQFQEPFVAIVVRLSSYQKNNGCCVILSSHFLSLLTSVICDVTDTLTDYQSLRIMSLAYNITLHYR